MAKWVIMKVFTITVDNVTANTNVLKLFMEAFNALGPQSLVLGGECLHLSCCVHIINLVEWDGFLEVNASVYANRNAIQYTVVYYKRVEWFDQKLVSKDDKKELVFGLQETIEFNLPHVNKSFEVQVRFW